jgi:hypothetical protein
VRGDGDARAVGSLNGHQPTFKNTKISQNRPETRMLSSSFYTVCGHWQLLMR